MRHKIFFFIRFSFSVPGLFSLRKNQQGHNSKTSIAMTGATKIKKKMKHMFRSLFVAVEIQKLIYKGPNMACDMI